MVVRARSERSPSAVPTRSKLRYVSVSGRIYAVSSVPCGDARSARGADDHGCAGSDLSIPNEYMAYAPGTGSRSLGMGRTLGTGLKAAEMETAGDGRGVWRPTDVTMKRNTTTSECAPSQ